MAQQTQLKRVIPVFESFMERFPTPVDLAGASLEELIRLWDGLGYQRRAVNLRRAAKQISATGWPTTAATLESLPGVGPYTAAAVACFAFGEAIPAVDTNLRRVISRWDGEALHGRSLATRATELIDETNPDEWNQAIMDLAATICRPRAPACEACPVATWCEDPSVYVPPPRQSSYEGSVRQTRAAILKHLAHGATTIDELAAICAADHLHPALTALEREGVIERCADRVRLAG